MDFTDLLNRPLPKSTVSIGGFTFELQALTSKEIDDLITSNPPEKGDDTLSFHPDMRYQLIASTIKNIELDAEQVHQLLDAWARPDVTKLQSAVFDLNWSGTEADKVPLSETGSEETANTP